MKAQSICCFLIVFTLIFIGCKSTSTEPEPGPPPEDKSEFLLYSLYISLVPGGTEAVTVKSKDEDGNLESFSVTSDDPAVATAAVDNDSNFTITAVAYGKTNLKIVDASGDEKNLPVQVYDPETLDTGELLIKFTTEFRWRWDDSGSGAFMDGSFGHPVPPDGFFALGSLAQRGYADPSGKEGVMVVQAKEGSDAIAHPVDYTKIWDDSGSGADDDGSIWRPVPPDGYVAMGLVAQRGYGKPSLQDVVCIREDLTYEAEAGGTIWVDIGSGADDDFECWPIIPPGGSAAHENAYMYTGTFCAMRNYGHPDFAELPCMHVLNVTLPMLAKTDWRTYTPKLTGYDLPPEWTVPLMAKQMLIPCTMVNDLGLNLNARYGISPFYVLERQVVYKRMYHNINQTSVLQQAAYTKTAGVTRTQSETFKLETCVEISVNAGMTVDGGSMGGSCTVSMTFGYETMRSVSELQEQSAETHVDAPPGKAVALWQRYNHFVLKRHRGTELETISAIDFGIWSFTEDQYPDE